MGQKEVAPRLTVRSVRRLEQWRCSRHSMRTVRRRIFAAHVTPCRGIIGQLKQVEIDAFTEDVGWDGSWSLTPRSSSSSVKLS